MSPASTLSAILNALNLDAEVVEEVQTNLSNFADLTEAEKNAERARAIETVFSLVFGGNATIKGSAQFEQLRRSAWSPNCWLSPKVIVTASTAQEVAQVLALCRFLGAKFSIRGGGHLQNPGFTSNDDGVVIKVGFGLRWLDVYKGLEAHGVTVTGGRVPTVGVAGLLLGGGLSFQNSEHGLSCMGVANYEVVLADSTIINANAEENADLFWALKGGGPNFGIVTKAKMTTVPNQVWAEGRLYSPTMNSRLLDALMLYHEASENDNKASVIWHAVHEATLVVLFYCAPVDNPAVFQCFDEIPFMARVLEPGCRTVYEVVEGFASVNADVPKFHEMRTMSSLPDLEVYKAVDECRLQQIEALKDVEGALLTMVIQPMSSGAIKACDVKGGTPLGLTAQNHQWFLLMADWTNAEDDDRMREACRKIIDEAETVARKNGTYLPFRYSNYASRDQDPLSSYGAENLQKLKNIARKYDPDGIFQTLQNDGWLVSKAG